MIVLSVVISLTERQNYKDTGELDNGQGTGLLKSGLGSISRIVYTTRVIPEQ